MSNGALPKATTSKSSVKKRSFENRRDQNADAANDLSFELKPKPKLTCIPENSCSKIISDHRKSQSMNLPKSNDTQLEKSWSVLFIGSKSKVQLA